MRSISFSISSAVFQVTSVFFCFVVSASVTSGDKDNDLAWSISGSLAPINKLFLRREISIPNDQINSPWIVATHQNLPTDPDDQDAPSDQPSDQPPDQPSEPAPELIPDPQPGPAPVPESLPERPPLPRPQPVRIDQSRPGENVPVPVGPGNFPPAPVPVGVPIAPLPIVPVPPPAAATTSALPETPRRRRPAPQPVTGFDRHSRPIIERPAQIILPGPDESDYPSDEQIRQDILRIPEDSTVMYTEVGGLYPVRLFAERTTPPKFLYLDAFPYGYTWSNGRSGKWYQDFLDRLCAVFSDFAMGTVYLVSKYPYGPESDCSMWKRIEYPALQANPDVNEIILVDYTNINRQRPLWNIQYGEIGPNFSPLHKRESNVSPCPNADTMSDGYPNVPAGLSVDLTPILGAAAGWASVDIVQHRRYYPDVNSKLDVSILDAHREQIGVQNDAIAVPGQEVVVLSQLPYALRIIAPANDDEPLQFKYGENSWDSNDLSRCSFDAWKSDVREGICNFDY